MFVRLSPYFQMKTAKMSNPQPKLTASKIFQQSTFRTVPLRTTDSAPKTAPLCPTYTQTAYQTLQKTTISKVRQYPEISQQSNTIHKTALQTHEDLLTPKEKQAPKYHRKQVKEKAIAKKQEAPLPSEEYKKAGKSRAKIFKQQLLDSLPTERLTSIHRWPFGDGATANHIVVANWNVNGIRSIINKKSLYTFVNSRKPDILCISETKIDQKSFDQAPVSLEGYHSYWNFSKHTSGYSGVAIFSKFLPIKGSEDFNERQHSQEGRVLTLYFQKFVLVNIYAPTSGKELERLKYRERYDVAFKNHIKSLKEQCPKKPILIVGDLNVAHTELDTHPGKNIMLTPSFTVTERKGLTELLNMGFSDVFRVLHPDTRAYTWWYVNIGGRDRLDTPGLGRRIDYFVLSRQWMKWVKRCDILREFYGADHCPLQLQLDMQEDI